MRLLPEKLKTHHRRQKRLLTPREKFGVVFDVVQLSRALIDGKTFVDCIPRYSPRAIQKSYVGKYGTPFSILEFVTENFILPDPSEAPHAEREGVEPVREVRAYIEEMWHVLTKSHTNAHPDSSLLPLPHPYVVPGGRFRELYYWDSYFTMLGLREAGHIERMRDMLDNFSHLIETYGFIPNGTRTYFLTRSQPPFFALMVKLLAEAGEEEALKVYRRSMIREHEYWMRGGKNVDFIGNKTDAAEHVVRMPDGAILNRYYDAGSGPREESFAEDVATARGAKDTTTFYKNIRAGAESGWDFSSRWFRDPKERATIYTTELVPADLNAILYMVEGVIAEACAAAGDRAGEEKYRALAEARAEAMRTHLWDAEKGWFCDFVHTDGLLSPALSLAGMYPLFAGVATEEQALASVKTLESLFLRAGGLVTTYVASGEQWDAPNGWAPLQWIAILGLERYGHSAMAEDIAMRWCNNVIRVFEKTGTLLEKYNVENVSALAAGGEYALQDGFGWTNGVLLALMNKYGIMR